MSIQPHILTLYHPKYAKITTQASYQNLGGYMASLRGNHEVPVPDELIGDEEE